MVPELLREISFYRSALMVALLIIASMAWVIWGLVRRVWP